ncbi:MAG: uroporphyrinogen-III synthase [Sphingobium sp.]|nr:uroporphyrinogen-III synthase [Sphingobium sp.]
MTDLLVLRPEPGASRTMARAALLGLAARACPLFRIEPLDWSPPPASEFDALLVTSAQAVRMGGAALARYHNLPAYGVGAATAAALREAGFAKAIAGEADGAAIARRIAEDGHRAVLHLAGADVAPFDAGPLALSRVALYAAVEAADRPELAAALAPGAVLLVHSRRAAARLATLVDPADRGALHLIAISPAAMAASGAGWASLQAAAAPNDDAMLALAAMLCK